MKKDSLFSAGNTAFNAGIRKLNLTVQTVKKENHMKKVALLAMSVLMLTLVFVGCSNDYTVDNTLHTLAAPKNVKSTVLDGAVILNWDPVVDAAGYRIIRKDITTGISVEVGNTDRLYAYDTIGYGNQLVDARKYQYSVVSVSAASTSLGAGADVVQNGVATIEVTAKVPAAFVPVLAATDVTAKKYTQVYSNGQGYDYVLVTIANVVANQRYLVTYNKVNPADPLQLYSDPENDGVQYSSAYTNPFETTATVRLLALGSPANITVTAAFIGDLAYYDTVSAPVTVTAPSFTYGPSAALAKVEGTSGTRNADSITLYWDKLFEATGYTIYKRTVTPNTAYGYTETAWTAITLTQEEYAPNKFRAVEAQTSAANTYQYAIIATGAGGLKSNDYTAITVGSYGDVVVLANVTGFSPTRYEDGVVLRWNKVTNATGYTIVREVATTTTGGTAYSGLTVLTVVPEEYSDTQWSAFDALTSGAGNYRYGIIATSASAKSPTFVYGNVTPYTGVQTNFQALYIKNTNVVQIQATWNTRDDATYKLEYAKAQHGTDPTQDATTANYKLLSAYTEVTLTPAVYLADYAVVDVTPADIGVNYIFRLTTTVAGVTRSYYAVIVDAAFGSLSKFGLAKATFVAGVAPVSGNPLNALLYNQSATSITLKLTNDGYTDAPYSGIQVYRRESRNDSDPKEDNTNFVKLDIGTANESVTAANWENWRFTDTGLDIKKAYVYKIVVGDMITATGYGVSTALRPNGYTYTTGLSGTTHGADDVAGTPSTDGTAGTDVKWPARALQINSGSAYAKTAPAPSLSYSYSGPNIIGLPIVVKYETDAGTATATLSVSQLSWVVRTTTGDPIESTTNYRYYIVLPANAKTGANNIEWTFPSQTSPVSGSISVTAIP